MRRFIWLATPAAALLFTALALPSSGATSTDRTAAFGPLGVTTVGMGTGPSYGEPSFAWAPDGRHAIICTPGDNKDDGSTVQFWHSSDSGIDASTSPEHTGPAVGSFTTNVHYIARETLAYVYYSLFGDDNVHSTGAV